MTFREAYCWGGDSLTTSSPSEDEELNGPSSSAIAIKSGGLTRSYRLSVPSTDATAAPLPVIFAAVAPVAGAYYPAMHTSCATGSTPNSNVSVLEIHGVKDGIMHYDGGASHGERYVAAPELAGTFAQLDGCTSDPATSPTSAAGVTRMRWGGCRPGVDVEHLAVADGGHNWPGSPYQKESGDGPYNHTLQTTDVVWGLPEPAP